MFQCQVSGAVVSVVDKPILKAAHHGIGERLQSAASDTAEALRSTERFFKEITEEEVLVLQLSGSDMSAPPETLAKFKQVMSEINDSSNRLAEALKVTGAAAAGNKKAVDAFQSFLQTVAGHAFQGHLEHFAKIIPTFGTDSTVDISAAALQASISSHLRSSCCRQHSLFMVVRVPTMSEHRINTLLLCSRGQDRCSCQGALRISRSFVSQR